MPVLQNFDEVHGWLSNPDGKLTQSTRPWIT